MDQQDNNNIPIPPIENPMATRDENPVVPVVTPSEPDNLVTPPNSNKKVSPLVIGMGLLLTILLLIVGLLAYQNSKLQGEMDSLKTANAEMESQNNLAAEPTPTATPDPTADWETYTFDDVSFKYPPNLTIDKSGMGEYISLLQDPDDSTSSVYGIDLRVKGPMAGYEEAESYWANQLENVEKIQITNGIKMVGEGTAESAGEVFTVALLKYGEGTISIVTLKTDEESLNMFDQILSTFEFIE